jgi:hypothetical protein
MRVHRRVGQPQAVAASVPARDLFYEIPTSAQIEEALSCCWRSPEACRELVQSPLGQFGVSPPPAGDTALERPCKASDEG